MTSKEDPLHRLSRTPTKASTQQRWDVWQEAERERTRPLKEWGRSPTALKTRTAASSSLPSCAAKTTPRKPTSTNTTVQDTPVYKQTSTVTPPKSTSKQPSKKASASSPMSANGTTNGTTPPSSAAEVPKKESPTKQSAKKEVADGTKSLQPVAQSVATETSVEPVSKHDTKNGHMKEGEVAVTTLNKTLDNEASSPSKQEVESSPSSLSEPVVDSVSEKETGVKPVSLNDTNDGKLATTLDSKTVIDATNKKAVGVEPVSLNDTHAATSMPPRPPPHTAPEATATVLGKIQVPTQQQAMKLFDSLDENASGKLSLAELDKGIVTLFPDWNHKPAIMAAYKAADFSGNGYVERKEFGYFLQYMVYYDNAWSLFDSMDENHDRRISRDEFQTAAKKLQVEESVFDDIDVNGGGMILFGELIHYLASNKSTWDMEEMKEIQAKLQVEPTTVVKDTPPSSKNDMTSPPPPPPPSEPVQTAVMQISIPDKQEGMRLFDTLDENASGKLSLAELDKGVVTLFPEWNNKPAIMAAYKACDRSNNGFVERKEFGYFLRFLMYYNNLWSVFASMDQDQDRRISRDEFVAAADKLDLSRDAQAVFDEIDANGGGMILFDELIHWMAIMGCDNDDSSD